MLKPFLAGVGVTPTGVAGVFVDVFGRNVSSKTLPFQPSGGGWKCLPDSSNL